MIWAFLVLHFLAGVFAWYLKVRTDKEITTEDVVAFVPAVLLGFGTLLMVLLVVVDNKVLWRFK